MIGPWERYTVCRDSFTGATNIASQANRRYVSAELAYGCVNNGMLRARATVVGPWEVSSRVQPHAEAFRSALGPTGATCPRNSATAAPTTGCSVPAPPRSAPGRSSW